MRKLEGTSAFKEIDAQVNRLDFKGVCDTMEYDTDAYWDCV
jgi:hypothetical protein